MTEGKIATITKICTESLCSFTLAHEIVLLPPRSALEFPTPLFRIGLHLSLNLDPKKLDLSLNFEAKNERTRTVRKKKTAGKEENVPKCQPLLPKTGA